MIKLRRVDKNTKHLKGRIVFGVDGSILISSDEKIFLQKLQEKILKEVKEFKYGKVKLEFMDLVIK